MEIYKHIMYGIGIFCLAVCSTFKMTFQTNDSILLQYPGNKALNFLKVFLNERIVQRVLKRRCSGVRSVFNKSWFTGEPEMITRFLK